MKTRARHTLILLGLFWALVPASVASAGGAGGIDYGYQLFDVRLSSADMGMSYITGYGYGVNDEGSHIGGFGTSFLSANGEAQGGVGGLIVGQEWRTGPVLAALSLWGGVGGGSWAGQGYMLGYGAVEAELGVRVLPWMQIVVYGEYQGIGNVLPGAPFSRALLRTPVFGIRIGWGGLFQP